MGVDSSKLRAEEHEECGVAQLGIFLPSNLEGAVEVLYPSVRIKSNRNDVPLYRGRSCNQERALERIAPAYSLGVLI